MEFKRFYDHIGPDDQILNRDDLLNSDEAKRIESDIIAAKKVINPDDNSAVGPAAIFRGMIERGILKSIRPKDKVRIKRLPNDDVQNYSPNFMSGCVAEGWAERDNDTLTIHGLEGDLVFNIAHGPSRLCLHCGEELPGLVDDQTGAQARSHIEAQHSGEDSPDAQNPSGYICRNFYRCEVRA